MGTVYLAHELSLDRDLAINVLPPKQAITPELCERFRREAASDQRDDGVARFAITGGLPTVLSGSVSPEVFPPQVHCTALSEGTE